MVFSFLSTVLVLLFLPVSASRKSLARFVQFLLYLAIVIIVVCSKNDYQSHKSSRGSRFIVQLFAVSESESLIFCFRFPFLVCVDPMQ